MIFGQSHVLSHFKRLAKEQVALAPQLVRATDQVAVSPAEYASCSPSATAWAAHIALSSRVVLGATIQPTARPPETHWLMQYGHRSSSPVA